MVVPIKHGNVVHTGHAHMEKPMFFLFIPSPHLLSSQTVDFFVERPVYYHSKVFWGLVSPHTGGRMRGPDRDIIWGKRDGPNGFKKKELNKKYIGMWQVADVFHLSACLMAGQANANVPRFQPHDHS